MRAIPAVVTTVIMLAVASAGGILAAEIAAALVTR